MTNRKKKNTMKQLLAFSLTFLLLSTPTIARKTSMEGMSLKGPATLTYDFSVHGGKNSGTTGTITFQLVPGNSSVMVSVNGRISAVVEGTQTNENLQGTYTVKPTNNSRLLPDIFKSLDFGTIGDPNSNEYYFLARILTQQKLSNESVMVSNLLMMTEDIESGATYPMPGTGARTSVRSSAILGKPVWVFTNNFGQTSEKISLRKDNGALYDLEQKTKIGARP